MEQQSMHHRRPVPVADFYSIEEVGRLLHVTKATIYRLARDETDPLPARRFPFKKRGAIVSRTELLDWVKRNGCLISEIEER